MSVTAFDARRRERGGAWLENLEAVVMAVVLALIIRQYVFEAFQIPTGSMSPTLLGAHRDVVCPNCGWFVSVGDAAARDVRCPNCRYPLDEMEVLRSWCRHFPDRPRSLFRAGGFRILVNKFLYDFIEPRRWDVVVFHWPYSWARCDRCGERIELPQGHDPKCPLPGCGGTLVPYERRDYVKRLVGMPGERLRIFRGDIYINGIRLRKPAEVQERLWIPDYDMGFIEKDPSFHDPWWQASRGSAELDGAVLRLTPDARGEAAAAFHRPIVNYRAYNGEPERGELRPVGDLKLEAGVRAERPGAVEFLIAAEGVLHRARIAVGGGETQLLLDRRVVARATLALAPGEVHHVAFARYDGVLTLAVDGKPALEHAPEPQPLPLSPPPETSGVALAAEGGPAEFRGVRVWRDIYYTLKAQGRLLNGHQTYGVAGEAAIPAGYYMMLGDNSPSSDDSRSWGLVPRQNLIGNAFLIWWPPGQERSLE